MTNEGSDENHVFQPHSDLYLANAIAHVIVNDGLADTSFISNHINFMESVGAMDSPMSMAEYTTFLTNYAPADVSPAIGISAADIVRFGQMYGDPSKKVVSTWTMAISAGV